MHPMASSRGLRALSDRRVQTLAIPPEPTD